MSRSALSRNTDRSLAHLIDGTGVSERGKLSGRMKIHRPTCLAACSRHSAKQPTMFSWSQGQGQVIACSRRPPGTYRKTARDPGDPKESTAVGRSLLRAGSLQGREAEGGMVGLE